MKKNTFHFDTSSLTKAELREVLEKGILQSFNSLVITDVTPSPRGPLIVYANDAFFAQTGYRPEELLGQSPKILQGPLTDQAVIREIRYCLKHDRPFHGSAINYRKDGTPYYVEWNISPIKNRAGIVTHYLSIQHDITPKQAMQYPEKLLSSALNAADEAILLTDLNFKIVFANRAFEKMSGFNLPELLGATSEIIESKLQNSSLQETLEKKMALGEAFHGVFENRKKNGSKFFTQQSISPVQDDSGDVSHFVFVSKDITESIQEKTIIQQALITDPLTGVLNRRGGEIELNYSYKLFVEKKQKFCIIFADIDYFKKVNDMYGHDIGDIVIKSVANEMQSMVRESDRVVRWGGEEFLIIVNNCILEPAEKLAERIRIGVENLNIQNKLNVTISMGIAEIEAEMDIVFLTKIADEKLYHAKAGGRNRIIS